MLLATKIIGFIIAAMPTILKIIGFIQTAATELKDKTGEEKRAWPPGVHVTGPLMWEPPGEKVAPNGDAFL